ncbi:MAG: hypothetical protein JW726_18060 [Anaerolineales bacterium]|nr:hypothetical protein [Anaerolineales bacterium]
MKKIIPLIILIVLLACAPLENSVETAIAQTQTAQPTATLTPSPSPSPTLTPTPLPPITPTPELCNPEAATQYHDDLVTQINYLNTLYYQLTDDPTTAADVLTGMGNIKRVVEGLSPPPCAADLHTATLELIDGYIDFATYTRNGEEMPLDEANAFLDLANAFAAEMAEFRAAAGIE